MLKEHSTAQWLGVQECLVSKLTAPRLVLPVEYDIGCARFL